MSGGSQWGETGGRNFKGSPSLSSESLSSGFRAGLDIRGTWMWT
jgi:hypothetical protein